MRNNPVLGDFSEDGLEYIIHTPHLPRDWFNYLWNAEYLASVSQNWNGNSLYQNAAGTVTNLFGRQDALETPRSVYLRDQGSGEYWSAAFQPCWTEYEEFECRHGLGYSTLNTKCKGIRTRLRVFVPRQAPAEIWSVCVTNESDRDRTLSLFTVSDIALSGVNMPFGYLSALRGEYLKSEHLLFFQNTSRHVVEEKYSAFMYATRPPTRWDASRESLYGRYRSPARPERVEQGQLGNSPASVEHLIGAMQHNLRLSPGASYSVHIVLGVVNNLAEARRIKKTFLRKADVEAEFRAMKVENIARIQGLQVASPDSDFNHLFSIWLKHQLYLMADWARFYFKGFRDTCQDAAGMSILNPLRALELLREALRSQRSDGYCPRAFRVASKEIAAANKHYADSPSWISHTTDAILRETGDLSLLDEVVEYSDQGQATLWGHNLQAMEFLWNDRGPHGLSLIHHGDWCDLLDRVGVRGKGESVWMTFALARVLKLMTQMAEWKGEHAVAARCQHRYCELRENLERHGRDRDWFLAAINDDGMPIGTARAKEGRMFINPQSWAMLSGIVDAEAYTSIAERMEPVIDTPVGPLHSWPPFTKYQEGVGQLSGTPPGFFTNGNVYCHAAAFKIAADFAARRSEKAFDTLLKILPTAEKGEPYAQSNGYVGPTALRRKHHVSGDPWRTGTVAWHFLNVVDQLLGFHRTLDGFHLRPQLPAKWKTVRFTRPFRGIEFAIELKRGKQTGITVDGSPLEGDFIPVKPKNPKKTVHVVCVLPLKKTLR
jgi:cellobiose phosphorylase